MSMEPVLILLVMSAGVSHAFLPAAETKCNAKHNTSVCSVTPGGSVSIQLMTNASGHQLRCKKQLSPVALNVFSLKRDKVTVYEPFRNRTEFFINSGTLKINNVERNDSGLYTTEVFDPNGVLLRKNYVTLGVQGVETYCDGRQRGAQCYGALGGTVVIQLMDSASEIPVYQWFKENTVMLDGRRNYILTNLIGNRSFFTPSNGTFRINELSRTDGGEYKLQTFDSGGNKSESRTLQLTIQAPVTIVLLVTDCLSQGEMKVSCSSEGGDSLQYSWTLDGRTLTDAELLSGNPENNSVTLKQHVKGLLVCSVSNKVSSVSDGEKISTCGYIYINCTSENGTHISQWVFAANNTLCIEPTTTLAPTTNTQPRTAGKETGITESISPCTNNTSSNQTVTGDDPWYISNWRIMAGVLSALVLLVAVGVAVIIRSQKKKQGGKAPEEDDQELTYADVNILQRPGRQVQQRAETEVEYGQIRFSERPRRQTVEPPADECVYAMVRKDR